MLEIIVHFFLAHLHWSLKMKKLIIALILALSFATSALAVYDKEFPNGGDDIDDFGNIIARQ